MPMLAFLQDADAAPNTRCRQFPDVIPYTIAREIAHDLVVYGIRHVLF